MKRILEKYRNTDTLVEVYAREDDTSSFCVGYVLALDDDFVLLRAVDQDGSADGYCLRALDEVVFVQTDTLYLRSLALLGQDCPSENDLEIPEDAQLCGWLLQYACEHEMGVSIELVSSGEMEIAGTVKSIDGDMLTVSLIANYGEDDGEAFVLLDRITAVDCDSRDERRLCRIRKEKYT